MTDFDAIRLSIAPELDLLNQKIHSALSAPNALMTQVIEEYLRTKGKLIRPILVILTAKLFGETNPTVISAAAAVEMLHNASLIHDDVVDEAKLRRNRATINSVWDNHIAVLVGDYFVATALQQAISTGDIRIIDSLALLGKTLSLGEIDQICNARYHCFDQEAYFKVINRKTASLFVSCVKMGAYAVGGDESQLDALCRFAELLGLCFQIRDDIFDYFPAGNVGKPTGNDLREGKITLPLLYALRRTDLSSQPHMLELAKTENLNETQIQQLIEFAKEAGGIEYAYSRMEQMRNEAIEQLYKVAPVDKCKQFVDLFNYIIARNF